MRRSAYMLCVLFLAGMAHAGTVGRLRDVNAQSVPASSTPVWLGAVGDRAWFAARGFNESTALLYRTDGTSAGTVLAGTTSEPLDAHDGRNINGKLVFFGGRGPAPQDHRLWSIDDVNASPLSLRSFGTSPDTVQWLASGATRGFFAFTSWESDPSLYATNGTAAGTVKLTTNRKTYGSISYLAANDVLYFLSTPTNVIDDAIWVSDGTLAGTRQVLALSGSSMTSVESMLHVENNTALVSGLGAQGSGLYSLDLSSGVATKLGPGTTAYTYANEVAHLSGLHFYLVDSNLWRTDGTVAGTFVLTDAPSCCGVRGPLVVLGNRVVFANRDSATGGEAWATDGTLAGTQLLRDVVTGAGGSAHVLGGTSTLAFFTAGSGNEPVDASNPTNFWVTDGTPAGTRMIPQRSGAPYALRNFQSPRPALFTSDRVYFNTSASQDIANVTYNYYELWTTDLAGTDVFKAGVGGYDAVVAGSRCFYTNILDTAGREPWTSDGSEAGTIRLRDIAVSNQNVGSDPDDFTVMGTQAFFSADDGLHGRELWVTDGTEPGTHLFKDIMPGALSSEPYGLLVVNGTMYFGASTIGGVSDGPGRLWRSDGTEAGTFQLGDTRASAGVCERWAAYYQGRVWFFGETISSSGNELWSTDGTAAGTRKESDLPTELRFAAACDLNVTANGLVFTANTTSSRSLWHTDGTLAGTVRLATLASVFGGVVDPLITASGGVVYFPGSDSAGIELWRSNGTAVGTARVADLESGGLGAQHLHIASLGNGIVFSYSTASGDPDGIYVVNSATSSPTRIKGRESGGSLVRSVGSRVFFNASVSSTDSLWATDGTSAGTVPVVSASAGSSLPINRYLAGDGVLFYFTPNELWSTDGTANSARKLGTANLSPGLVLDTRMAVLGNRPLFANWEDANGSEPWTVRNVAPIAIPDNASVAAGANVLVNVRANDTDSDSANTDLRVFSTTVPAHGSLTIESGSIRYTPANGFTGTDTFDYQIADEFGATSAATTVTVIVTAAPSGGGGGGGGSGGGGGGGRLEWLMLALLGLMSARRARGVTRSQK